ncbi:MAG: hypothetical protein FWD91_05410 [Treponema sp.]|nr:hypothetical protein [Treponema sp.]
MRQLVITIALLCISVFGYAQHNMPSTIRGRIPNPDSPTTHQIQIGAFLHSEGAGIAFDKLRKGGFNPVLVRFDTLHRVILSGISARQVVPYLVALKAIGFDSVIVREDSLTRNNSRNTPITEKWVITEREYQSFEFTQDNNFIVIGRASSRAGSSPPPVYFGNYSTPQVNIIVMDDFGTIRIVRRNNDIIDFYFSPIDEPQVQMRFIAVKEKPLPRTPETDLFTKTWVVINSSEEESVGMIMLFSIHGTYLISRSDGESFVSQWRWHNEDHTEFEYSHTDWLRYGKAKINLLNKGLLSYSDTGFYPWIEGLSVGNLAWVFNLVPLSH